MTLFSIPAFPARSIVCRTHRPSRLPWKKLACLWTSLVLSFTAASNAAAVSPELSREALHALETWLGAPSESRPAFGDQSFGTVPLTKEDAARAVELLWKEHASLIRANRDAELKAKVIELDGHRMKFETVRFGEKIPPGGQSLFISMHGGGGAPAEVNDSQWRNQIKLAAGYQPREGIYVAPRAPTDTWDLWHQAHIDGLFSRLIEDLIVVDNVNPNRVYLLGYSAGGDGVYQLAPRMADRLAAAAMMAGHPNDASPLGLRNIGFAIQVGANDAAYNRNKVAGEWGKRLDQLQQNDPAGYVHFSELHEGKGHWMEMADRKAIPWMEKLTRNPLPEKIVWHQDDVTHPRFYWLAEPQPRAGDEIVAERHQQTITVTAPEGRTVIVRLNDAMLELDQPVTVIYNGKPAFAQRAARTIATLFSTLNELGDPELIFSAEIKLPENGTPR
ncbi:MAG: hypothetical protein JWL59_2512 [Chthoniobacteraceae bacterium]|nr:hypothetical protein [Chthoniobacteraceae bacterium]